VRTHIAQKTTDYPEHEPKKEIVGTMLQRRVSSRPLR